MKDLQAIVQRLAMPSPAESVLATLVSVEGSSYRQPGARLLVLPDGSRLGSISGGCLEEDILIRAQQVARTRRAEATIYDTTSENDLVWGVGLGCNGIVRLLIEPLPAQPRWAMRLAENFAARRSTTLAVVHRHSDPTALGTHETSDEAAVSPDEFIETILPPVALHVFGAGDDTQPLVRFAKELGWHVTVADPRPAFATPQRFPMADAVVSAPAGELVQRSGPDLQSVAVVMTHHYVHDVPLLKALLPMPLRYLGLLGPKKRAEKILSDLTHEGLVLTAEKRARLHAPVGLDLGAEGPEQVALAIVAEIQAALSGHNARPLRERTQPIHG
jgi:xanthine dehydrogenase accessory factor